jgi:hypothetical protein
MAGASAPALFYGLGLTARAQEGQLEARWLLGQPSRFAYVQRVCELLTA